MNTIDRALTALLNTVTRLADVSDDRALKFAEMYLALAASSGPSAHVPEKHNTTGVSQRRLHRICEHPDFEYVTTYGEDTPEPYGHGWVINQDRGNDGHQRLASEDRTATYWRRLKVRRP